jgi:hypothetical protein
VFADALAVGAEVTVSEAQSPSGFHRVFEVGKPRRRRSEGVIPVPDNHLDDLKLQLERRGLSASLRGQGRAAFLFVECEGKAVEISDHEGRWWVEFWDASEDEDAAPVKDSYFATPGQAVDAIAAWLLPRNGPGGVAALSQTSVEVDRPSR